MNTSADSPSLLSSPAARHDVVIVGGRVAGAATALLLARAGLRVLVLERGAAGSDALSTHALMRAGVMQLHRWGLLDTIIAAGTPPIRRTTFTYADDRLEITLKPSHGIDALYAPRRTLLDPTLAAAAVEAGAAITYGTTVVDLLRDGPRVTGVRARRADGRTDDIPADLVIGADGVHSVVAELVGAEVLRRGRHSTATTYGHWSGLDTTGYEWLFRADACAGVIPTNDGRACVFASARPERMGRGGVDVIRSIVAQSDSHLAARLDQAIAPGGTRTWGGMTGYVRRAHGPGWALVGDAGYFKDPISAHGLTDALRDAELLAGAAIAGLGGARPIYEALAEFEATRNRVSMPLFDVADRIASNEWDDAEIAVLLRRLSSSMADEVDLLASLEQIPAVAAAS